jgi:predicted amidophosphoribosyltransferase
MSSKRCSNCGHMIPSDSAYCVECGAPQPSVPAITSKVSRRPPIKIRAVYVVIMFVSLAIGASFGYFLGVAISPPMARTVTET